MITAGITGDRRLDRKLAALKSGTARRAIAAGVKASLKPCVAAIKSNVNAATASARLKRAARQIVASSVKRVNRTEYSAKAGFAVGKQTKARRRKAKARHLAGMQGQSKGVGVSAANIHWFVLGTRERSTKSGHPTGRLRPVLSGIVQQAFAASKTSMMAAAKTKIASTITRESRRK